MSETNACPECGVMVPADAPRGLCPRCLMGAAYSRTGTYLPPADRGAPAGGAPRVVDRDEFLRGVRELDLLPADELDRLTAMAPDDAPGLARVLVGAGKLTTYQAGALLQGKGRGLVIGAYVVREKLGEGGMGVVFKATHRPSGRLVALKILPPSFGRDSEAVRRFRREFQIASRLSHPNVVAAIEASEDRGVHYLTMEYIPGYDLDRLVAQGGPMALKLALHCTIQVARGLEAAHAQGVIHRDIKPGNVMIDPAGAVRVLDLGLARVIEATSGFGQTAAGPLTQTGSYMGTVDFLAPEQANDAKSADGRADIYSLGCTLYYLLTGKPPFPGDTVLKRLMAHQDRPAPSLRAARAEVPEALESTYQKMMAKRPGDRPQTVSEVILALEACRTSAREAGDVSADLKTFARTALKRAPDRKRRGPDASVFARPTPKPDGLSFDPDLNLEDLITDYRPEGGHDEIPEEKLPPIAARPMPKRPRRRQSSTPFYLLGLIGVALAAYFFWPRSAPVRPPALAGGSTSPSPIPDPPNVPTSPTRSGPETRDRTEPSPRTAAAAPKLMPAIWFEEFDTPARGWPQSGPEELARKAPDGKHGYDDGVWYAMSGGSAQFSWNTPSPAIPGDFDMTVAVRVVGDSKRGRGSPVIHFFSTQPAPGAAERGFQIRIDGAGQLFLEPSFWTAKEYPDGPWKGPVTHPAIQRGGGPFNEWTIRVRKRRLEILVNDAAVVEPITFGWDLTPMYVNFGVESEDGIVRAEYDRVEIREIEPGTPPIAPALDPRLGQVILASNFGGPIGNLKPRVTETGKGLKPNLVGFDRGSFFMLHQENWQGTGGSETVLDHHASPYQIEVTGRAVGGTPAAVGSWGVVVGLKNGRGLHVEIDRQGALKVSPPIWSVAKYPNDPRRGPIKHAAIRPGDQFNTVTLRVEKRRVAILVNGNPVLDPIDLDYDILPAGAMFMLTKPDLGTSIRAEFDRVEVRELRPAPGESAAASPMPAAGATAFRSLFNGRDLAGWAGDVQAYEVNGGLLSCKPGRRAVIYEPIERKDFVARVEYRVGVGADSGLAIRHPGNGSPSQDGMCEIQIIDDTYPAYAKVDPRSFHGSAWGLAAAKQGHLKPPGQWNVQEVTVRGSTIHVELNGAVILDVDLDTIRETEKGRPHPGKGRRSGYFGLFDLREQNEGAVEFRTIETRDLTP